MSGAPNDGMVVWRPDMSENTQFFGTTALGVTLNPLRIDSLTNDARAQHDYSNPIQAQFIQYFMAGTQIANVLGLGVSLPVLWYQITGDDPRAAGVGGGGIGDVKTAAHDLRFDARVKLFESSNREAKAGLGGAVWAPIGNPQGFTGDIQTSGWLFANAELEYDDFLLALMIGPHFRPPGSVGGANGVLSIGSELRYALGAFFPLRGGQVRLGTELWGQTGIGESDGRSTFLKDKNTHFEWLAQARLKLGSEKQTGQAFVNIGGGTRLANGYGAPDIRALVAIGYAFTMGDLVASEKPRKIVVLPDSNDYAADADKDGYPDDVDECPTIPEDGKPPEPSDGCQAPPDTDGDGLFDRDDRCPNEAEDKDGLEDEDGCPEADVDNDGVLDAEDACPTEPGTPSEEKDKNGCLANTRITQDGRIEVLAPIQFATGLATLKAASYPILDEVVVILKAKSLARLGVYGHTDSVGQRERNLKLSQDRAAAVVHYLVEHGIDSTRLESDGFGPDEPVADNATPEGRAKNRRVEFKLLEAEAPTPEKPPDDNSAGSQQPDADAASTTEE